MTPMKGGQGGATFVSRVHACLCLHRDGGPRHCIAGIKSALGTGPNAESWHSNEVQIQHMKQLGQTLTLHTRGVAGKHTEKCFMNRTSTASLIAAQKQTLPPRLLGPYQQMSTGLAILHQSCCKACMHEHIGRLLLCICKTQLRSAPRPLVHPNPTLLPQLQNGEHSPTA